MTADNKSNAGRKENRDVVLYRTLRLHYGAARLMIAIVPMFSAAFTFTFYRARYTSSLRRLLVFNTTWLKRLISLEKKITDL